MSTLAPVRGLFLVAWLYDFGLGLAFLVAGPELYERFGVTPPNHWGYVQFAALLLMTFGLMFLAVALRPRENRNLILYGVLLKLSYGGVVLYHWTGPGLPDLWKPFAVLDLAWVVAFLGARARIPRAAPGVRG